MLAPDTEQAVLQHTRLRSRIALFVCLVLMAGLSYFVSCRIRQHFAGLSRLVHGLGGGDLQQDLPESTAFTPVELREFRHGCAQMLERLRTNDETTRGLVSELEQANRRLRPLAEAWEQIGEAVEILDSDGNILFANPACEEMLGKEATRPGARSTIWDDDRGVPISASFALRKRWTGEVDYIGPKGRQVQAVAATPVFHDDRLERVVVIRLDLTDLRAAESMAAHSERLASLGTLAAGLAHEINNPLTYVLMNLESIQETARKLRRPDLQRAAAESLEGAGLIQRVVQEMLLLSRGRDPTGRGEPRASVDLKTLLESSVLMARARFRDGVRVNVSVENDPRVWVRETELKQVFVNLIVNAGLACSGTGGRGQVSVSAQVDPEIPGTVVVEVRDNGVGMTQSELRQAFDPFYTTRQVGQGTGLGPEHRGVPRRQPDRTVRQERGLGVLGAVAHRAGRARAGAGTQAGGAPAAPGACGRRRPAGRPCHRALSRGPRRHGGHRWLRGTGVPGAEDLRCGAERRDDARPRRSVAVRGGVDPFAFVTGAARGSSVARAVQEAGRRVFHKPLQARQLVDWLESLEFDNDPSSQA